jgi:hypothetical protein
VLYSGEHKAVVCVLDLWSGHRNSGEVVLTGGWVGATCGTLWRGGRSVEDLSPGVVDRSLAFRKNVMLQPSG